VLDTKTGANTNAQALDKDHDTAALDPCLAEGQACKSGLDCCCGYCLTRAGQVEGQCGCEVPMCSKIDEKCTTAADCCPPER
jgi:hypothetical protein